MSSNNNILIAQGGGPTNVINQSLAGIIINEKKKNLKFLLPLRCCQDRSRSFPCHSYSCLERFFDF